MGNVQYLADHKLLEEKCRAVDAKDFLDPTIQLHALAHCAARLANETADFLAERVCRHEVRLTHCVCRSRMGEAWERAGMMG